MQLIVRSNFTEDFISELFFHKKQVYRKVRAKNVRKAEN